VRWPVEEWDSVTANREDLAEACDPLGPYMYLYLQSDVLPFEGYTAVGISFIRMDVSPIL